ncbi:MAG: cysteine--tRNA ligase [Candidatus Aminicenantes bacterium RBG_13_64_14]|nr:MAG: cysteine--tRNA ligase [Candidatus Aminicenantes bacterium RBG_13_64_14]
MIRFHNTLSGKVESFEPIEPGSVKLYTCGPTVYDFPHIGNWRAYVFEDLLKRFLIFSGYKVTHVMNLTDVDDKTIRGAGAKGLSLEEYTRPFIEAFDRERDILNILPANHYPRATEHIREMVEIIQILLDKTFAYRKDGSIYFAIAKFPAYGRLSKVNLEDLRPGSRGDADEYEKDSVHDFALWKAPKEGEPVWETEIGPGRPGWHVECSAMSSKYLGRTFDIHCGGVDNIFPHHENEIAQSEAANGVKFVNYWLHCHHLVVDGEKMAKSKGNFYTLADILAKGYDPYDVRYLLISTHYRKMLNFTFDALEQAKAARSRLGNFFGALKDVTRESDGIQDIRPLVEAARAGFVAGLEDDLNISESLASLFSLVKIIYPLVTQGAISRRQTQPVLEFFFSIDEVLAIKPSPVRSASGKITGFSSVEGKATAGEEQYADVEGRLESEIQKKIEARQKARSEKDFNLADEIREELLSQGILLEDTKDGVRWKKIIPPGT